MGNFASNAIKALKNILPYVGAGFGTVVAAYLFTILLGFLAVNVIPNLGLNVSGAAATSATSILQTGVGSVYKIAAIMVISTGLMSLAVVVQAFGMNKLERFNISSSKLVSLIKNVGMATGIYAAIVFALAIFRIILGYLQEKVTNTLGFTAGSWVLTSLNDVAEILVTLINAVLPLLDMGVALITLGLVLGVFGFQFSFGGDSKKKDY